MSDTGPRAGGGGSRRALLRGAGAALMGAGAVVLGGCGRTPTGRKAVKKLPKPLMARDVAILGRALELERRTVDAYVAGIPLLSHPRAKTAEQFLNEELQHTGELLTLMTAAGGTFVPRATSYDIGHPTDEAGVISLLHTLEALQIASYLRSIPELSPGPVRAAVASILTVDAQHLSMLRLAQGQAAVPSAFVTGTQ